MAEIKYLYFSVFSVNIMHCFCYVNYELFRGFDDHTTHHFRQHTHAIINTTTDKMHDITLVKSTNTTANRRTYEEVKGTGHGKVDGTENGTVEYRVNGTVEYRVNGTVEYRVNGTAYSNNFTGPYNETSTPAYQQHEISRKIKHSRFKRKCPETERPISLGSYEIPTQRDLVLFTKRTLLKLFNSYHTKTLYLLKDIKEATRATVDMEKKCRAGKALYKQCVKIVSKKCVAITKDLVASLERQEAEVAALTEEKICDMSSMRTDPIELIKRLAMDEATMDFALPAFLRLLGGCTAHCYMPAPPDHRPRLRQLTDQDLVVRHFLTSKNYVQLIKDTNTYV